MHVDELKVDQLDEALADFTRRLRSGEAPSIGEYVQRYPHLSDAIHELFPTVEGIESMRRTPLSASGGTSLESSAGPRDGDLLELFEPPLADGEIGRVGDYRILKLLGRGGMGAVFLAEDVRLRRTVALKMMLPHLARKSDARQRFLREAQIAASIEHDHIVAIYQVGEANGHPFIAMQYLRGTTLEDRIQQGPPLSIAEIVQIGREVASGLTAAHARDLIHRDVKPANIFLEERGSDESLDDTAELDPEPLSAFRVKLLDFGLARPLGDVNLTHSGIVVGTPAYMAPERARAEEFDGRADLFSLGVVLYRLTTGTLPFAGKDAMAILMSLAVVDPLAPARVNPKTPLALSNLIQRLLAKDASRRPESAQAVVESFDTLSLALAPPRWRRRAALALVAVLALAVVGAGVAFRSAIHLFVTNQAELTVDVDDPEALIRVLSAEMAEPIGPTRQRTFVLTAGAGNVQLWDDGKFNDGVPFDVSRGGRVAVRVEPAPVVPIAKPKLPRPPLAIAPFTAEQAKAHQEAWAKYLGQPVEFVNRFGVKMALVPPGQYQMGAKDEKRGSADEHPSREVTISRPFYLGVYETTRGDFIKFFKAKGYLTDANRDKKGAERHFPPTGAATIDPNVLQWWAVANQNESYPVFYVSWNDAKAFCAWLGEREKKTYRLPTEAEWEYACRAGTTGPWSWGNTSTGVAHHANFADEEFKQKFTETKLKTGNWNDGFAQTAPVGQFQANAFGLYDMHGNLAEWVEDWYDANSYKGNPATLDPRGPAQGTTRVTRGGSWGTSLVEGRSCSREGRRAQHLPSDQVGFRVLCEIAEPK